MVNHLSIYKNKNVLVTGHTGFKGAWIYEYLKTLGANTLGISNNIPTSPNHFSILNPDEKFESINICDSETLMAKFREFKPDIIFHLAAQSLVRFSYNNPLETYQTNLIGSLNILECTKQLKSVKALVNVTTDKCYQNNDWIWGYRENDQLGGHDPYSASKACVEIMHASFIKSFLPLEKYKVEHECLTSTVRAGNVIGGGDWSLDRIIPDIIRAGLTNSELEIRNPQSIRPWQHVLDPIYGYLQIGSNLLSGDIDSAQSFNLGPVTQEEITVAQILEMAKKYFPNIKIKHSTSSLHEANTLKLDSARAIKKLKWNPRYKCEEAVNKTFEWYLNFSQNKLITQKQIYDFQQTFNS
jgi:CDP-glucose 4,6-dehydratase